MFHPNKTNPERFRVLDKELKIQKYFSIKQHGLAKAKKLAEEFQQTIDKKKRYRQLKRDLGINKLFREDGSIKGVKRIKRERPNRKPYECFAVQVTIAPKTHKSTEIIIKDDFQAAYEKLQQSLLSFHNIENSAEIKDMFAQAKRLYW